MGEESDFAASGEYRRHDKEHYWHIRYNPTAEETMLKHYLHPPFSQLQQQLMNEKFKNIEKIVGEDNKVNANAQVAAKLEELAVEKEVQRRLAILESWEDFDEFEDGTVLKFDKQFEKGKQVYTYAALKVNGAWYLTGTRGHSRKTSKELEKFLLAEGEVPTEEYEVATPEKFRGFDEPVEEAHIG